MASIFFEVKYYREQLSNGTTVCVREMGQRKTYHWQDI